MSCQNGPVATIMMYVESLMNQNESKKGFFFFPLTDYFVLTVIQVKKCITQEEEKPFSDLIRLQNVVFQITALALFCARLEKKTNR